MERTSQRGMSLIELAMVLVIMGLVGTLFYNFLFSWIAKEKTDEAGRAVATAGKLVTGYVLGAGSGALPDPENNPNPLDGEDGGYLPASLGLGNDPWGRRLRYWSAGVNLKTATTTDVYVRIYKDAAAFATDHSAAPGGSPATSPTGQANADSLVSNVAYVVMSLGKDGRKQFRRVRGSTYIDVLKPGLTSANAGGSGVDEKFDDQFSFMTLEELKTRYDANAATGIGASAAPAGAVYSTSEAAIAPATLAGGATVTPDASVPDGQVLDLTADNAYVDLSEEAVGNATYTNYTIMGWFKTTGGAPDTNFDVITARQRLNSSDNRTWWVVLWSRDTLYVGQGDGKDPGEIAMKASPVSGSYHFQVDTNCRDVLGNGSFNLDSTCHRDGKWHFFAVVMSNSGATYTSTIYVNYTPGGALTKSSTAYPYNNLNTAPDNAADYKTFIGREPGNTRDFKGYLDDINIYDSALSEDAILAYYNANKASYQ